MDIATFLLLKKIDYLKENCQILEKENAQLRHEFKKVNDEWIKIIRPQQKTSRNQIDCGIGQIGISFSGSIDIKELIDNLEECIKNNGVKYTIDVLNAAK